MSLPLTSATDITTNTDNDSSGTLSGTYSVTDGATWTVSGDYDIAENTSIIVEAGATMIVTGSMDAVSTPQLNLAESASVIVPIGDLGDSGLLRITFADEILYGITIEINNVSSEDWTGSEFDWTGNMDVDNITINVSTNPFQVSAISEIILSPDGSTPEFRYPSELSGTGISLVIPDRTNAWSIDVQGTLIVSGSIFGAAITCSGTCTLDGAQMTSTGPIEVMGSISVTDSVLSGGISDEDIILWDDAQITWTNSSGTGGTTDNWVNILTTRTIGVQNGYVVFYGYEMGYNSLDTSPLRDNSTFDSANMGDNIIEIGPNERARMVRWQDGNGTEFIESASGKLVLVTLWGNYEHDISELPHVNHFDVEFDLPMLSFDSLVASDDESNTNKRLGVMATFSNEGDTFGEINLDCVSNDVLADFTNHAFEDANVGVTVPYEIGAGETIEIPLNWDSATTGEFTLECSIFVPAEFNNMEVVSDNSGTATTETVTWSEVEDNSSNLILPISIGVVVAVILYVVVARMRLNNEMVKEHLAEITEQQADDPEETGTIE